MARILIVEDEKPVAELVARALRRANHLVSTAGDGRGAIQRLHSELPELVILDIVLPDMSGFDICRYMRSVPELAATRVLMLTGKRHIDDRITGFEAGADDYLVKPFDVTELQLRIQALLRHVQSFSPEGRFLGSGFSLNPATGTVTINNHAVQLTPSEFHFFSYLVAHPGEVISAERLLQEVWGYPPGTGTTSLVRTHVLNVRRKIEPDPGHPQYLCTIAKHGYILRPPEKS